MGQTIRSAPRAATAVTDNIPITRRAAAEDFRIRRTGNRYTIWQRIGSGWEKLSDTHHTRADAQAFIREATA